MSLEIAILGPALLLTVFAFVQGALWFYARSLAQAAAHEGLTTARTYHGSPEAGAQRTRAFLTEHAADTLTDTHITLTSSPEQIRVEVTGRALSVLPGVPGLPVTQTAQGPREHLTDPP